MPIPNQYVDDGGNYNMQHEYEYTDNVPCFEQVKEYMQRNDHMEITFTLKMLQGRLEDNNYELCDIFLLVVGFLPLRNGV